VAMREASLAATREASPVAMREASLAATRGSATRGVTRANRAAKALVSPSLERS
jgi:hypothetical protein